MSSDGLTERLLRRDRQVLVALIGMLLVLAGLYTVFGVGMRMSALEMTAMSGMRDMPGAAKPGAWSAGYAALVFMMWWVMMAAMMLPSVAPTVLLHAALLRMGERTTPAATLSTAFLAGYLVIWAAFSVIASAAQWGLEASGLVSPSMMTLVGTVPGGLVLLAAGVFQFTPLKAACLRHCRSPARFLTERRRRGRRGSFLMGVEHGAYCLGCCWFLMALLFVGGVMNLYWIAGLAAFVAVEKLTRFGPILGKVAGAALIAAGIVIVASNL
jgi:predicted metal-binding membrane protein